MAARIDAHVSLVYETVGLDRLRAAVGATAPLRLRLTRARRWETEPGIYLDVQDPLADLRRFRAAVLDDPGEWYHPHVTLLHKDSVVTPDQADEAWTSLREIVFDAEAILRDVVVYDQVRVDEGGELWEQSARLVFALSCGSRAAP